jgi:hypothetical protein
VLPRGVFTRNEAQVTQEVAGVVKAAKKLL